MDKVPEYFLQIRSLNDTEPIDSMIINNYCMYKYTNDFRIILNLNLESPIYIVKKNTNISPYHYKNLISLSESWNTYPSINSNISGILSINDPKKNITGIYLFQINYLLLEYVQRQIYLNHLNICITMI